MARTQIWTNHLVGMGHQTFSWNISSDQQVTAVKVEYLTAGAKSVNMYYENGNVMCRKGNTVTVSYAQSGSMVIFAGGTTPENTGGYVNVWVEHEDAAAFISVANISVTQTSTITFSGNVDGLFFDITWSAPNVQPHTLSTGTVSGNQISIDDPSWLSSVAIANPTEYSVVVTVRCDVYGKYGDGTKNTSDYRKSTQATFTLSCNVDGTEPSISPQQNWYTMQNVFDDTIITHQTYCLANRTYFHIEANLSSSYSTISSWKITPYSADDTSTIVYAAGSSTSINQDVYIPRAGVQQLSLRIYDSRGRSTHIPTSAYNFLDYFYPSVAFNAYRCIVDSVTDNKIPVASGTRIAINIASIGHYPIYYTNSNNDVLDANGASCRVYYKTGSSNSYLPTSYTLENPITQNGIYLLTDADGNPITADPSTVYTIKIIVWDRVTENYAEWAVSSANVYLRMEYNKERQTSALGIGAYPPEENKEVPRTDPKQYYPGIVYMAPDWAFYTHGKEIVDLIKTIIANPNYPN